MSRIRWTIAVLFTLACPVAAAVAALVYVVLRRRWPDRAVAAVITVPSLTTTYLTFNPRRYEHAWLHVGMHLVRLSHQPIGAGDWVTIVGTGLAFGPAVGGLVWLVSQYRRERSPFSGADERERRQVCEERRRLVVTHAAQRARHTGPRPVAVLAGPLAVNLGDEAGPLLGRFQRGDMRRPWRTGGRVRLPMNHPDNRHLLILGATGLGKTETALTVAEWGATSGFQVVYLTCKEPPSAGKSVAPRLAAVADTAGLPRAAPRTTRCAAPSQKSATG
jgi:hypothetical protein